MNVLKLAFISAILGFLSSLLIDYSRSNTFLYSLLYFNMTLLMITVNKVYEIERKIDGKE